jgi:hypothetical protein
VDVFGPASFVGRCDVSPSRPRTAVVEALTADTTMSIASRWDADGDGITAVADQTATETVAAATAAGVWRPTCCGVVTATTFLGGGAFAPACIAAGHHSGDVSIELLPTGASVRAAWLSGHEGAVTALVEAGVAGGFGGGAWGGRWRSEGNGFGGGKGGGVEGEGVREMAMGSLSSSCVLLSGGVDCTVRVWDVAVATAELFASTAGSSRHASSSSLSSLAKGEDASDNGSGTPARASLLAVLRHHSAPVRKIIPAPQCASGRISGGRGGGGGGGGGGSLSSIDSVGSVGRSLSECSVWDAVVLTVGDDGAVGVVSLATGRCEMLIPGAPTARLALTGLLWDTVG